MSSVSTMKFLSWRSESCH